MRTLAILMLCAAVLHAQDDAEVRFLRAWYALGDPDKSTAAEVTLRRMADAADTPPELKARCLLGLAEAARLRGDEPAARALLEEVVATWPDAEAAARARRELGGQVYLEGIRRLWATQYLDLDTGIVWDEREPCPGAQAELVGGTPLVETAKDPQFAGLVAPGSDKPWLRVRTSEGRTAWVQVLEEESACVVRFVTRWAGLGTVLPAPRGFLASGGAEGITLRFEPARAYARYRVERATAEGEFREIGTVEGPPFVDREAKPRTRYRYRITGETPAGARGLPALLGATTASRGVVSGTLAMDRNDACSFDLLTGEPVIRGDLRLMGTFGGRSGASFADAWRRLLTPLQLGAAGSAWDAATAARFQIQPGEEFLVPLRDGGVARCRLEIPPREKDGPEVLVHYAACGDAPVLPCPVRLVAERDRQGARVRVEVEKPWRVETVEVADERAEAPLQPLAVVEGVAYDPGALQGHVREYRAVAVDPDGRRSAPARTEIALFPDQPRAGEFQFHYKQGYSLERGCLVPPQQADVVFATCAGGISSITLAAPGGIVNLQRILPPELDPGIPETIFDLVVGADPRLAFGSEARGDSRTAPADVFVLRTRHGGWAKLAITHRGSEGGWTEHLATVKYVFHPTAPKFGQEEGQDTGGVRLARLQWLQARAEIVAKWQEGWQEIVRNPERRQALEGEAEPEAQGALPDPQRVQEVLSSRQRYGDYEKATFNFAFGVRDDPGRKRTRNDWCLQYGNGGDTLEVCMVTDDRSTITDLGERGWEALARIERLPERGSARVAARYGHVYLIHTLDRDENFFALMRVTALRPADMLAFEWVALRDGRFAASPGLTLDAGLRRRLAELLGALPKTPEERWEGKPAARAAQRRLETGEFRIGAVDSPPGPLLSEVGEVTGVPIAFPEGEAPAVSLFGTSLTPAAILDEVARQTGRAWEIAEDGSVVFRR